MNFGIASGNASNTCFLTSTTTATPVTRGSPIANSSMASCGDSTPVHRGAMSRPAMGRGKLCMTASVGGGSTAPGSVSLPICSTTLKSMADSVVTSGVSMPRSFALPALRAGRKKNPDPVPCLRGRKTRQFEEPPEHALGYSRGGFGTKAHLLIESHGIVVGIYLTGSQRNECKAFAPLMDHLLLVHHRNRPFWPRKMAGDKGYSYPEVRGWLERHHIQAVIPTRSNQPPDPHFDKVTYRRRNLIERVVGWFKECRALGTRYEKLAVSYLALWFVAMIDKLLKRRLSDSA
jgi:transposase